MGEHKRYYVKEYSVGGHWRRYPRKGIKVWLVTTPTAVYLVANTRAAVRVRWPHATVAAFNPTRDLHCFAKQTVEISHHPQKLVIPQRGQRAG